MAPGFQAFALEEWQSRYEQGVEFQLADSGVQPVRLRDLVELGADLDALLDLPLHYPEVNGTAALRGRIADLYPGQTPANVLVTVGAAEANALVVATLAGAGDEVVAMVPSYPQVEGIARNRGCRVRTFGLDPDNGWRPDLDELEALVTASTRLIAICSPNNPTGRVLDDAEMRRVVDLARRADAWLLSDEVYAGTERWTETPAPSLVGRYERVIAVNSTSKAYGLSGLRLGWVVAPQDVVDALWRRHEYVTIATSALSMALAEVALRPAVRSRLLARSRALTRRGAELLEDWVAGVGNRLSLVPPAATSFGFVRVHTGEGSLALAHRLRREAGVLVAPGACFGRDDHLRICHAMSPDRLPDALQRISRHL
ncbi:MAG TPA: aminotransferase class I/II-fold pyridoxal phosphate-dependent enzyme [Terriglobales bacterium]|nr:aminotransferase class I/II-fold pyridoxal phosphate-dependent enzyme [Terriglobales bacterium]